MRSSRIRQSGLDYTYNYQQRNGTLNNYGGWSRVYSSGTDTKTDTTYVSSGLTFTIDGTVQKHVIFRSWIMLNIPTGGGQLKMKFVGSGAGRFYEQNNQLRTYGGATGAFRTPSHYNFANSTAFTPSTSAGFMFNVDLLPYNGVNIGIHNIEYLGSFFVDTGSFTLDLQWAQETASPTATRLFNNSYLEYVVI